MAYSGLSEFVSDLENRNELARIKTYVDPVLEITEITDRVTKAGGKALLFENTGTKFPVLINAYGSDERMALSLGRKNLNEAGVEIEYIFKLLTNRTGSVFKMISALPRLLKVLKILPSRSNRKGICQQVINRSPDLGILPILKCWPHDGDRFITLPIVHTIHPESGKTNVGMYRMQILDKETTAMHWQRHKTGANHYEAWKKVNKRMPVSVALGGDPVYAYSATAPLPEDINEYILAGFLRKKRVKLVKCITNDIYVPYDADIVIEGYVDPSEELIWEGPFGDHTGFYSLADWYPKFHVTCITHSRKAVYPATIVGIPPQEDVWLAKATEKIFLPPLKMTLQPEIIDFHLPDAGVAHNLLIVKIRKSYPGQGMKVISSLLGAGQMMFTKYLIVVSGEIDIRDYYKLLIHITTNIDFSKDLLFCRGPLDVLDHSSDNFSFGGKVGIDATIKLKEEGEGSALSNEKDMASLALAVANKIDKEIIKEYNIKLFSKEIPLLIVKVNTSKDYEIIVKVKSMFRRIDQDGIFKLILCIDHTVDVSDLYIVAWQILGNSDPQRDHDFITTSSLFIDGTAKAYRKGGFPRRWPNVVCSDPATVSDIDRKWDSLNLGPLIPSPSSKNRVLSRNGADEIILR